MQRLHAIPSTIMHAAANDSLAAQNFPYTKRKRCPTTPARSFKNSSRNGGQFQNSTPTFPKAQGGSCCHSAIASSEPQRTQPSMPIPLFKYQSSTAADHASFVPNRIPHDEQTNVISKPIAGKTECLAIKATPFVRRLNSSG